jgi:hypothetical protein
LLLQITGYIIAEVAWWDRQEPSEVFDDFPNFFRLSKTLWGASTAPDSTGLFDRLRGHEGDKLSGDHRFTFELVVPKEISINDRTCMPPPSFMEPGTRGSVIWNLRAILKHGKFGSDTM